MDKLVEKFKAKLDNKKYISKTRFDTEFSVYRKLSKAFFNVTRDVVCMIPPGIATYPVDEEQKKEYEHNLYKTAKNSTIDAQDLIRSNIPFISKELYDKYEDILKLCFMQIKEYENRWNKSIPCCQSPKEEFSDDAYRRSGEIRDKFIELNEYLRDYLSNLEVVD